MGTSNSPLADDLSTRFQLSILVRILGSVRSAQQALIRLGKSKGLPCDLMYCLLTLHTY